MDSASTQRIQAILEQVDIENDAAYDELIEVAWERLHRLARKMLKNYPHLRRWEQTDDVAQNAALRLHRSLSEVRPDTVRRFWGLAITQIRRELVDLARHHFGAEGRGANHETDCMPNGVGPMQSGWTKLSDRGVQPETLSQWAMFHDAVDSLPQDEREVFELVWYGNLEQTAIADILGISLSTVKRRWRTAKI